MQDKACRVKQEGRQGKVASRASQAGQDRQVKARTARQTD
jgi:hypothetical protein